MIRLLICGAAGRMGERITALALQSDDLRIAGLIEAAGHPRLGAEGAPGVRITGDIAGVLHDADGMIDFSGPAATIEHLAALRGRRKFAVVGTTGFTPVQHDALAAAARDIPIVCAPNMSRGVTIFFALVREAARLLADYDAEIVEAHHSGKKDAPSGTALKLAELIEEGRGCMPDGAAVVCGRGAAARPRAAGEIGISAMRAGDIVGEHTVYFASTGERIELTHRAQSRDTFAAGALLAGRWVAGRKPGLYNMVDVLGLRQE